MTRSMAKTKQANVPSIYPLKGEHKKPEHTKQVNIDKEVHEPNRNVPDVEELPEPKQIEEPDQVALEDPGEVPLQCKIKWNSSSKTSTSNSTKARDYPTRITRPNPLFEPSYI